MFALPTQYIGCLITLPCLVFKFEVEFRQRLLPPGLFGRQFLLIEEVADDAVIRLHYEL